MTQKASKIQTSNNSTLQKEALPNITLVLGGARSGKSAFAEDYLLGNTPSRKKPLTYIATSRITDPQMQQRIVRHQQRRSPQDWQTIEEPIHLDKALLTQPSSPALVDCLTLWLSNLIIEKQDVGQSVQALRASLLKRRAPTVLITNEVGMSIVPINPLARQFTDEAGLLNQAIASIAQQVFLVVAGLPLALKTT